MKSPFPYIFFGAVLSLLSPNLMAQSATFTNNNWYMAYFGYHYDDPSGSEVQRTLCQPDQENTCVWDLGTTLYFCWSGDDLYANADSVTLAETCPAPDPGSDFSHQYTASNVSTEGSGSTVLGLMFYDLYWTDYGIVQFFGVDQQGTTDPDRVLVQSNHVMIDEGQMFRIDYLSPEDCTTSSLQFIVKW